MRGFIICLTFLFFATSFAQEPDLLLRKIGVIGVKQVDGDGFLILSKGKANDKVQLTKISSSLTKQWMAEVPITKPFKGNYNLCQILHTDHEVYVVIQNDDKLLLSSFNLKIGSAYYLNKSMPIQFSLDNPIWGFSDEKILKFIHNQDSSLYAIPIIDGKARALELFDKLPSTINPNHYQALFTKDKLVYSSSYNLSPSHSSMKLYLAGSNTEAGAKISKEHVFDLQGHSFTYNSSDNEHLAYFKRDASGFYAFGFLDIGFKGKYPTQRVGSGFVGVWIAKFNFALELIYFQEIPFSYYEPIVPHNAIHRQSILEIKEDANGGVFLSINEMQQVLYGDRYIIYLDKNGDDRALLQTNDAYHFFEYDKSGLRSSSKSNKVLLINDDWAYYETSFLQQLRYVSSYHSKVIYHINELIMQRKDLPENVSFTFFRSGDDYVVLEYVKAKKGSLNFYAFTSD